MHQDSEARGRSVTDRKSPCLLYGHKIIRSVTVNTTNRLRCDQLKAQGESRESLGGTNRAAKRGFPFDPYNERM